MQQHTVYTNEVDASLFTTDTTTPCDYNISVDIYNLFMYITLQTLRATLHIFFKFIYVRYHLNHRLFSNRDSET